LETRSPSSAASSPTGAAPVASMRIRPAPRDGGGCLTCPRRSITRWPNHAMAASTGARLYVVGGYGAERSAFVFLRGRWQRVATSAGSRGGRGGSARRASAARRRWSRGAGQPCAANAGARPADWPLVVRTGAAAGAACQRGERISRPGLASRSIRSAASASAFSSKRKGVAFGIECTGSSRSSESPIAFSA
jgi:hypothetical protein